MRRVEPDPLSIEEDVRAHAREQTRALAIIQRIREFAHIYARHRKRARTQPPPVE